MANEFLSLKNIARQALPRLIDNLVMPNLIHHDYSDDFEVGKGATVQIRKPVTFVAKEFNEKEGTEIQDVKEGSIDVTLDKLATVDIEFGAIERATSVDSLQRLFLEPAAAALASKINSDGLALANDVYNHVGEGGSTPDSLGAFAAAAKVLDENRVPTTDRYGVWSPSAMEKFRTIGDIVNAEKSGSTAALRAGSIGNIFGIQNYMTQGVINHQTDLSEAELTLRTKAENATTVIIKSEATVSGNINVGDVVEINGKSHVITQKAVMNGTTGTITVTPAVTEEANVPVKFAKSHAANLVFHKNAFAFVTRPLVAPAGAESYVTSYNGISLRVVRGYSMKYKKEILSMDVLYGYKTIDPNLAGRVLG